MEPVRPNTQFGAAFHGAEARTGSYPVTAGKRRLAAASDDLDDMLAHFDHAPPADHVHYRPTSTSHDDFSFLPSASFDCPLEANEPIITLPMAAHLLAESPTAGSRPETTIHSSASSLEPLIAGRVPRRPRSGPVKRRRSESSEPSIANRMSSPESTEATREFTDAEIATLHAFRDVMVQVPESTARALTDELTLRSIETGVAHVAEYSAPPPHAAVQALATAYYSGTTALAPDQVNRLVSAITTLGNHAQRLSPEQIVVYKMLGNAMTDGTHPLPGPLAKKFGESMVAAVGKTGDVMTSADFLRILHRGIEKNILREKPLYNDVVRKTLEIMHLQQAPKQRLELGLRLHSRFQKANRKVPQYIQTSYENAMRKLCDDSSLEVGLREPIATRVIDLVNRKAFVPEERTIEAAGRVLLECAQSRINGMHRADRANLQHVQKQIARAFRYAQGSAPART